MKQPRITTYIIIVLIIVLSSCKDKTILSYCNYHDLCDSSFYISFDLNEQNYQLDQNLDQPNICYPLIDSVLLQQKGFVYGDLLLFQSTNSINSFTISFLGEYLLDEISNIEFRTTSNRLYTDSNEYYFSTNDTLLHLDIYEGIILPSKYYSFTDSLIKYDSCFNNSYYNKYDEFVDNDIFQIDYVYKGFSVESNMLGEYWDSRQRTPNTLIKNNSYFLVDKIDYYRDNIFIIDGTFSIDLYSANNDHIQLDNGHFHLVISMYSNSIIRKSYSVPNCY